MTKYELPYVWTYQSFKKTYFLIFKIPFNYSLTRKYPADFN